MQIKPTQLIILDTRRQKKSGLYPIKLRITFQKVQKYYPVGADLTQAEFDLMQIIQSNPKRIELKLKRKLQDIKFKCDALMVKATDVINKLPQFSFRLFEKKFLTGQHTSDSVYLYYEETIKQLKKEGRVGTASNYQTSMNSLKTFSPKLLLRDVTIAFLKDYETWLKGKQKSDSTVGIYLRPLRAILNQAMEEGAFLKEDYPFGKRRYQIPASRNIKKALTLEEIGKIAAYEAPQGSWHQKARDMFLFSYLANGINMKDILLLKYGNIDGDSIRFVRAKTKRTNRTSSTPIVICLNEDLKEIISRWGNENTNPDQYIFPVLQEGMTPEKEMAVVQQFTKMVNTYLKKIVQDLKITKPVTTYFARHSFATVLKQSGASPLFIGEALGHASTKTTENYLDSFEDDQRKVILQNLTKYKTAI